jgi:hypothetical protein
MSEFASPGIQQIAPLPITGSGGQNSAAVDKLNNVSVSLASASLQAAEDSKYDPKVVSGTPTVIRPGQGFCSPSMDVPSACMLVGVLLIVYGMIAK